MPVLLFLIGLFNLDNCPDRPQLPYLVFGIGFVMTASNLFNLALALDIPILTNHRLLSLDNKNIIASILNILFNCIVALLYILTTYMIYTVKSSVKLHDNSEDNAEPNREEGISEEPVVAEYQAPNCSGLLYHFTFWFITLTLGVFVLLSLIALALFAYNRYRLAIIRGSTPRSQSNAANNANAPATNGTGSPFGVTGTTNSRLI